MFLLILEHTSTQVWPSLLRLVKARGYKESIELNFNVN